MTGPNELDLFGLPAPVEPTQEEKAAHEAARKAALERSTLPARDPFREHMGTADELPGPEDLEAFEPSDDDPVIDEASPLARTAVEDEHPEVAEGETYTDSEGRTWMKVGTRGWKQVEVTRQDTLFDLGAVTVRAADADIKERLDKRGVSAGAYLATYETATIKQVVLYFRGDAFRDMVVRLRKVMKQTGTDNNTDAVVKLLEHFEGDPAVQGRATGL